MKTTDQKFSGLISVALFMIDFKKKVLLNSLLKTNSIIAPYSECLSLEL